MAEKGTAMRLVALIRSAVAEYRRYHRLRRELARMNERELRRLGLDGFDAAARLMRDAAPRPQPARPAASARLVPGWQG